MSEKTPEHQARDRLLDLLQEKKKVNPDGIVGLLAILAPQIRREFHQPFDPSFFDYHTISKRVKEGKIHQRASDDFPDTDSDIQKQFFYLQFDLRKKNIHKILDYEFHPGQTILEIGSGELDKRNESFLSSSLRKELSANFFYCDIDHEPAHATSSFKRADITKLSETYRENQFDFIVGLNVLDTLSLDDLHLCLKECVLVLKPGGRLIHLMNLEPYVHAFYHNIMKDNRVVIPFVENGVNRKVLVIPKESYQEVQLDEEEIVFFDYLVTLSGLQQERLWTGVLNTNFSTQINLFVQKLAPFGEVVEPMPFHLQLLREAFDECGFNYIEEDDEESYRQVSTEGLPRLDRQHILSGPFGIQSVINENLPLGTATVGIYTHASIAQVPIIDA